MFDWTVRVTTPTSDNYYALDANDYSLIKSWRMNRTFIPCQVLRSSYTDKYVMPRLNNASIIECLHW